MAKHDNRKKGYGVSGLIGGKKSAINRYALKVKNDERYNIITPILSKKMMKDTKNYVLK